jgi:hypothetical protein
MALIDRGIPCFLQHVFGLEAQVIADPTDGTPVCLPVHRRNGRRPSALPVPADVPPTRITGTP